MKRLQKTLFISLFLVGVILSNEVLIWVQYGNAAHNLTVTNFDNNAHIEEGLTAIALQFWNTASDGSIPYITGEESSSRVSYWVTEHMEKGLTPI